MKIIAVDQPDAPPLEMPARFRSEIVHFTSDPHVEEAPDGGLGPDEYWIDTSDARRWLDDMVLIVISPLAPDAKAEIELSDDHERFLDWLVSYQVRHVRLER